jgi:hypothetical protein
VKRAPHARAPETEAQQQDRQDNKPTFGPAQAHPPREHHDPLTDDVIVLWPSPRRSRQRDLEFLAGRWQGPGSIAELRRAGGRA